MAQCIYCGAGICDCKASSACHSCTKKIEKIQTDSTITSQEKERLLKQMYANNKQN